MEIEHFYFLAALNDEKQKSLCYVLRHLHMSMCVFFFLCLDKLPELRQRCPHVYNHILDFGHLVSADITVVNLYHKTTHS